MHIQSLKLLVHSIGRRCIYKKIHNLTVDLDLGLKATQVALYPLHHVTYAHAQFEVLSPTVWEEMHLQENSLYDL